MSDDQFVIQPDDDDLSKPPEDLNDYHAWLRRGELGLAFEGVLNKAAIIVGHEQTSQMLVKQLRQEQAERDEVLGRKLEMAIFGLKNDQDRRLALYEERTDARLVAYNEELDTYRRQNNALLALVEERLLGPFLEVAQRVDDLETGYAQLADQLDAALDPTTPGATVAMVALQTRIGTLERLVRVLLIAIAILALLSIAQGAGLIGHHYYIWERLR